MTATIEANLPVFVVIMPLFVAFILPTLARRIRLVEGLVIATAVLGLMGAGYLASEVLIRNGNPISYSMGGWPASWGIQLSVGNLSCLFLLMVASVSLPVSLFASDNMTREVGGPQRTTRFYALCLMLGGALAGMAMTADLFNVFVLVEVATLSCCGLVCSRNHPRAAEAAFNYLILATLGSALILGGIGFLYMITGYLNMGCAFQELNRVWQDYPHVVWIAASFFLVGFGVKSALFPLHVWLPDAHSEAPSPASAILSGLAVKGYAICLIKVLYNVFGITLLQDMGMDRIVTLMGMIAIIAGSVFALTQDELKRRLAFSTVAQVGYVFLGLGIANSESLTGTLFHMASHAVIKSGLFLAAGAIIASTGKSRISEMAGVGKKMPITMGVFSICSMSLVGIPLFSGFIGKWNLLLGSVEAGNSLAQVVIIAGSVLCAAYLFPVIRVAYFEPSPAADWQDPGLPQKTALVMLAAWVMILGVVPGPFLQLAKRAAVDLLAVK